MAFIPVDATWFNTTPSYDETELRRADAAMFAGAGDTADPLRVAGGIVLHASNSLAVTVDGSDVVTVQAGGVAIPGNNTAGNGVYRTALGAAQTASLVARDATNSRIDLVVFEVISGGTQAQARIIAGVPSGAPAVPALPTRAVELGRITVPASGGGPATVDNSKRTFATALGAIMLVPTASQLPATAAPWQQARTLDTGDTYTWDGAAWDNGAWKAYTPAWTAVTTNPVLNNGTIVGKYRKIGKTIHFRIKLVIGSTTLFGSGEYRFSLPSTVIAEHAVFYAPIGTGFCRDDNVSVKKPRFVGVGSSTTVNLSDSDGALVTPNVPFTFAVGDIIMIAGEYEEA
jgi:hypothetical protein